MIDPRDENTQKNLKKSGSHPSFAEGRDPVRPLPSFSAAGALSDMPQAETRQARLDIALDWLMRARQAPDDARLHADMQQWLDADPENAEALRKAERVWQLTGQLTPGTAHKWPAIPDASESPVPKAPMTARPRRRRTLSWAVGGALAACLVIALNPTLSARLQADFATASNERREVQLPDGSRATLDRDSAIAADFSGARRNIRLLRGQAFFEVQPDRSKPFNVQVQNLDVTVTGTAFNVDLESRTIEVAVQHGSVRVSERDTQRLLNPGLMAGQRLDVDRYSGQARLLAQPASRVAIWRDNQLIADNARLGDMVDELQRYLPGKVWLKDPQLAELRITGVYDTRNPQAALQAMAQPHGAHVESWTPWLQVLTR
ncbi:FecR family protein [Pseudomonas alliivorans]|nr:FecR family protein [Pseudomonas alliivorans]MEE4740231.1 FecR family protein [Pseudomonas alliivorans]MEE5145027.1 FecR family protein [Pseudomonas alliivorans]